MLGDDIEAVSASSVGVALNRRGEEERARLRVCQSVSLNLDMFWSLYIELHCVLEHHAGRTALTECRSANIAVFQLSMATKSQGKRLYRL